MIKTKVLSAVFIASATFGLARPAAAADVPACEVQETVRFGGMNWESNLILADVERYILEKGYGCQTEVVPTETLTALAALERGDLQVNTEIWLNSISDAWARAEKSGKVKRVGELYIGREAWYIPKYTAEKFPDLKSAADLIKHKDAFADPETPDKGRIYGCPAGWNCQLVATNLAKGLKLDEQFEVYAPGTGAAQKATLMSSYKRKKDIVFYYWEPTPLVSMLDLVKLEMPAYDEEKQQCLTREDCADPQATAYPDNPVFTALNAKFMQDAPQLTAFFSKVSFPVDVVNKTLAHMEESGDDTSDVALWFLNNQQAVWSKWVPAEVAERVKASL
ncbi:glycine/betaine ABC transporter substrate-binding protein [Advenella sp. S44]|uniref:ABC transporter substrate-binding protein n=1 Tax=Advenella sp. S44 TaxID=1982755 RepID=UPI000C2B4B61|nr:ABC transporter substrate-binding protein [Advenella sp. S44]PJX28209.1 glycine/betaine ABC transporter substrate-binding protein [Advenella sp. S44]